jgi:coenzyme F420-reducing hydrogenase beta subunit
VLAVQVEKLLFIGVGCQVQALRSVEKYLPVKKLYVMGTNCVDNGKREGLDKFLNAASETPDTALHYEFMQVHTFCSLMSDSQSVISFAAAAGLLCCRSVTTQGEKLIHEH